MEKEQEEAMTDTEKKALTLLGKMLDRHCAGDRGMGYVVCADPAHHEARALLRAADKK